MWKSTVVLSVLLAPALLISSASAAPGDLDGGFGTGGRVVTDFQGSGASALALQGNGAIVAVGNSGSGHFAIARYKRDGTLDPSFGSGGTLVSSLGGVSEGASAVAVRSDGKILAVGTTAPGGYCCVPALARYNADGALDPTFGSGGVEAAPAGDLGSLRALALQPDGKILVAGSNPNSTAFAVARFNGDGSLDPTFGTGGVTSTDFGSPENALALALQPDGKTVVVGDGGAAADFALARYLPTGAPDTTFGAGGQVLTDFGGVDRAAGVAVQSDGKIVAAGSGGRFGDFAVARYNPDGSLDASFGTGGKVTTSNGPGTDDRANAVAIQANGKIVVAGTSFFDFDESAMLARYLPDGSLDPTFGTSGTVLLDFGSPADLGILCNSSPGRHDCSSDVATALALQPDGKIVVAGGGSAPGVPCGGPCEFALARYQGDPVAVPDTTPPTISSPSLASADATSPSGATVTYSASATDPDDGVASFSCEPASATTFPIGTTLVTCTASDTHGNTATASFPVHVSGADEQLTDLQSAATGVGIGHTLQSLVSTARGSLARGQKRATCILLRTFTTVVGVEASGLRGAIPSPTAAALVARADQIERVLAC